MPIEFRPVLCSWDTLSLVSSAFLVPSLLSAWPFLLNRTELGLSSDSPVGLV